MQSKDRPGIRPRDTEKVVGPGGAGENRALEAGRTSAPPLLMVDIDGVLSLFGAGSQLAGSDRAGSPRAAVEGSLHSIEGIPHYLSASAAAHLHALAELFELVWASGWEERANEHLPHLLGVPGPLPFLRFERDVGARSAHGRAHWKLDAIDAYAGRRPLAWVDDALDERCRAWARSRPAPTLLVQTDPQLGLTDGEVRRLAAWARALAAVSPVTAA